MKALAYGHKEALLLLKIKNLREMFEHASLGSKKAITAGFDKKPESKSSSRRPRSEEEQMTKKRRDRRGNCLPDVMRTSL